MPEIPAPTIRTSMSRCSPAIIADCQPRGALSPIRAMTTVAARRYRDGKLVAGQLPADCAPPAKSEFDWVGLVEPTEEEMQATAAKYGLHPLAVEDAMTHRQAPKA